MKKIEKSKTYGFYSPIIKKFKIKNLKSLSQPAFKRSLKDFNKLSRKNLIQLNMYYIGIIYNLLKSKLPQLKTIKQKALPKRKTKRKFSKKQLAWQKEFGRKAKAGIFSPKHPSRLKRRRR